MPELPEVEIARLGLVAAVQGQCIRDLRLGKPLRWPLGLEPAQLRGRRIVQLRRRGKYIVMQLDRGVLLWHLGMSGRLDIAAQLPAAGPHDHVQLDCEAVAVRLHDPRRFGAVVYAPSEADSPALELLARLGAEPLDQGFTAAAFAAALRKRRGAIKPVLLSGQVVVGVGNIYASEALFRSGIHPARAANRLSLARVTGLHQAIQGVLSRAIQAGGSSLKDYRHADGSLGYFQLETRVYERQGQPCVQCQTPIRRMVQGQRSTYYCPQCQR